MSDRIDFTAYRHPVLAVACPRCNAGVNAHCKRPSGHQGNFVEPHSERKRQADEIWERQGDWPILRLPDGTWAYAVGEQEDVTPGRPPPKAAPTLPAQGSLL
jgi:hypothetical protein